MGFCILILTRRLSHTLRLALCPAGQNLSGRTVVGSAMVNLERSGTSRMKEQTFHLNRPQPRQSQFRASEVLEGRTMHLNTVIYVRSASFVY